MLRLLQPYPWGESSELELIDILFYAGLRPAIVCYPFPI